MPLATGERLGPYEILAAIGAGGMGEVYRARDTRLGRDVAIKVSAERFSERLEREARAIAALNHPHIATLYDVGEHIGALYLAMEFVDGAPLKGPRTAKEAVGYAIQLAEGLAAAHEAGIVHRDLKPANILVTEKGSVKILDFGLAKLTGQIRPGETAATQTVAIAGTPGYLAPEQLQGKSADARNDIFAFGCILYELWSGRRACGGKRMAASLAATAMMEPEPLKDAPEEFERLIRLCLRKDPERRLQHIGDARIMLEDLRDAGPAGHRASVRRSSPVWAAALAVIHFREKPAELLVVRSVLLPPEKSGFAGGGLLSPDGRRIVFTANSADGKSQVWVRSLDTLGAQPLPLLDGEASGAFWSPDGRGIGFFADGKLKKIDVAGGPALTLADAPALRGGSWSPAGVIVYAPDRTSAILRVASAGGAPSPVTKLDTSHGESSHRFPWFLPDGRHFLFSAGRSGADEMAVRVGSLDSLESKVLLEAASSNAIYSQGYVLFLRESTFMAQPFDAKRLALTGAAAPLAEQVQKSSATLRGFFTASETGLLAYRASSESDNLRLAWMDRTGKRLATAGDPARMGWMRLSPDQKRAAVEVVERNNNDIWIYDLARGLRTRFTFDPAVEREAEWSPDGQIVVFNSNRKGHFDLYRKASDGTGTEELLYSDGLDKYPNSWSPDGRFLLYTAVGDPKTGYDVWLLPLAAGAKPIPLVQSPSFERNAQFSPDGRWVLYDSNESGRDEIYVIPFRPEGGAPGGKRQVSAAGGTLPRWSRDGKQIFYLADRKLMAAEVAIKGGTFEAGQVTALFAGLISGRGYLYDVGDGPRFLAEVPPEQGAVSEPLTLIQNWAAGLKK